MARSRFFRSIVFAVLAGACSVFWLLLLAPSVGYGGASALSATAAVVLYPLVASGDLRSGLKGGLLSAALLLPAALATGDSVLLTLALLVLGLCRGVCVFPRPFARALVLELLFLGVGLLLAAFFYDGSLEGIAFATWAFWLVQAGFALTLTSVVPKAEALDPFERAQAAAAAVLERRGR